MTVSPEARETATLLAELMERVEALERTDRLANSSVEGGALDVYDTAGELRQVIGQQPDGTYTLTDLNGPPPPVPTLPLIDETPGALVITWDGKFVNGEVAPADFSHVEVHLGPGEEVLPTDANQITTFKSLKGESFMIALPAGEEYSAVFQSVNTSLRESTPSGSTGGRALPVESEPTDGIPPASSPTPQVIGGIGVLHVRWTPILNADPVTYDVYVSDVAGFVPDPTTLVASVQGSAITVKRLAGEQTDEYDPNLAYETPYYARIIARDADGSAPAGGEASSMLVQVTGGDVAADTIQGRNIVGGSLTGDLFSGTLVLGSRISTGAIDEDPSSPTYGEVIGQRVDIDTAGVRLIDSSGKPVVNIPTDPGTEAMFTGEVRAKGLTVQAGATFESKFNEISRDGALNLSTGTSSPVNAPSPIITWDQFRLDVTTQRAGELGTFALNPAQVAAVGKQPQLYGGALILAQNVSGGCRLWYMNHLTGEIIISEDMEGFRITGLVYVILDSGSGIPCFLGEYTGGQWYVWSPAPDLNYGLYNKYDRLNPKQDPSLGWDESARKLMVMENDRANDRLVVRRLNPTATAYGYGTFTTTNFAANTELESDRPACCLYGQFDYGANRFITSSYGNGYAVRSYSAAGVEQVAEEWSSAAGSKRGIWWDGEDNRFGTLDSDGTVYYYTSLKWTSTAQDKWWMGVTWYDSDPLGAGTHETTLGKTTSLVMKKRSRLALSMPEIPNYGAVDDPDKWRLYMTTTDKDTIPASTSYHLQDEGVATQYPVFAVNMGGLPPPGQNNFGGANPGYIRSGANRTGNANQSKFLVDGAGEGRFDGLIPPASMMMWGGAAAPTGWLLCDGSTRNIADYPDLYANLGGASSPFGVTATTFNLPDMRSRFPVGVGTFGGLGNTDKYTDEATRTTRHDHSAVGLTTDTYTHTRQTFYAASGATAGLQGPAGHSHGVSGATGGGGGPLDFPHLSLNFIIKT